MWIIVVFIMVLGSTAMGYRAVTDHQSKPQPPASSPIKP
jgi:hypothetical protein